MRTLALLLAAAALIIGLVGQSNARPASWRSSIDTKALEVDACEQLERLEDRLVCQLNQMLLNGIRLRETRSARAQREALGRLLQAGEGAELPRLDQDLLSLAALELGQRGAWTPNSMVADEVATGAAGRWQPMRGKRTWRRALPV